MPIASNRPKTNRFQMRSARRGVVLVLTMVVIVLMTLSVFAFSRYMMAERKGSNQSLRRKQARLLAESGIEYLRIHLMKEPSVILELGGLYDNETEFRGHIVTDGTIAMTGRQAGTQGSLRAQVDRRDVGRFSVIAPRFDDYSVYVGDNYRSGLEDESAKVNLRWIMQTEIQQPGMGRSMLLRLPGMTEEIVDSILDWMDEDTEPREFGAEDEYYAGLDPPYYPRNGIPDSIDELLLVKGITPKLLYGIDWNRNGMVDIGEPSESTLDEFGVTDGSLNLGLASYLTLDSRESNVTPDGLEKINVNMDDLEELRTLLEERFEDDWVEAIISYRQQTSSSTGTSATGSGGVSSIVQALTGGAGGSGTSGTAGGSSSGTKINSLLDLVQSSTSTTGTNSQTGRAGGTGGTGQGTGQSGTGVLTATKSPFTDDPAEMNSYLPILYDNLTISDKPISGRININQASRSVMNLFTAQDDELTDTASLLSGQLDETNQMAAAMGIGSETSLSQTQVADIIEDILNERVSDPNLIDQPEMNYPFWPYTHGIVTDLSLMKQLEPYFCTGGGVFKATIIGRFDEQSPVVRLEVWLDATTPNKPAKVIRIRELTELGPGYSAEQLGADDENLVNQ